MCTLLLALRAHPRYPLILAANRDEYYQRPTAGAALWQDAPQLFAGRDLVHGGTWLGITSTGRISALTNYRQPADLVSHGGPSRGLLVSGFLQGEGGAKEYVASLRNSAAPFGGYNLLMGGRDELFCYSSKSDELVRIAPGIHGLSNHLLDTPWPKVTRGKDALAGLLAAGRFSHHDLFAILADRTRPPDEQLPDTGVGLELERLLSPIFIESERYGTRCSSVLLVESDWRATFVERSFDGAAVRESSVSFDWS